MTATGVAGTVSSMAPTENPNPTSPKGDGSMADADSENTSTAVTHNEGGVSTVPKDPAEAERQRTEGAATAKPAQPASDGD